MSDPWLEAWGKLKACVDSGATEQQVTDYAVELGRGLPSLDDPEACARRAEAVARVVREILDGGAQ